MIELRDVRGVPISLHSAPQRIVSLVPSDTYTLLQLGAGGRLVARTEYCIEPAQQVATIEPVGGVKNPAVERIIALQPDVVIANREENRRADVERLESAGVSVFVSHPVTVEEGLRHAQALAQLLPLSQPLSAQLLEEARDKYRRLADLERQPLPTFVPIWMSPMMTVAGDTFVSDALALAGGRNVFAGAETRYPRVTLEQVQQLGPALVLLPDEPYSFSDADVELLRGLEKPDAPLRVAHCDGKDLAWYGLRCLEGLDRVVAAIDAARFELPATCTSSSA